MIFRDTVIEDHTIAGYGSSRTRCDCGRLLSLDCCAGVLFSASRINVGCRSSGRIDPHATKSCSAGKLQEIDAFPLEFQGVVDSSESRFTRRLALLPLFIVLFKKWCLIRVCRRLCETRINADIWPSLINCTCLSTFLKRAFRLHLGYPFQPTQDALIDLLKAVAGAWLPRDSQKPQSSTAMARSGLSVKYDPGVYVDTIHLNVGVGDCSIVCKYELLSGDDTGPNRMLKSAVIIDGGFQSAAGVIKKCITQQLGGLYNLTEMGGSVKFDSVVITHWDRDHWGGVLNLIVADLIAQLKQTVDMVVAAATAAAGARGLTEEQIQKIESQVVAANTAPNFNATDPTVPRIQSSYFKYDGPPGTGKPLTTLYVPYWDVNYKSGSRHGPKATMNNSNRMLSLNGNWGAVFDLDIKPVAGTPRSWILSLCRLNETAAKNLGKDLLRPPGLTRPISVFLQNSTSTGPQNLASFLGLAGPITGPEGDIPEPALVIVACAEDGVWNYGKPATKAVVQASRSESVGEPHRVPRLRCRMTDNVCVL